MSHVRPQLTDQYCAFLAAGSAWAISAAHVREVADLTTIIPVPESPDCLLGVCHLRTEHLPVLELTALIGESWHGTVAPNYLLVLESADDAWAVPIDRPLRLTSLEIAQGSESTSGYSSTDGVLGTASLEGEVIRVLDSTQLYRSAREALDELWQSPGNHLASRADRTAQLAPVQRVHS